MVFPAKLTEKITLLGTEYFSLYLVEGETYAIIDGGISGIASALLEQLNQLAVPPEAISHLVILHSHFDHMMAFPTLKEKYPWLKIVSSQRNEAIFSNERILAKIFASDRKVTRILKERGVISEAPSLSPGPSFPLDLSVRDGTILDLGKTVKIRFFDLPGHSPDCLGASLENEGVLFCSDAAGFYLPPDFFRPNHWFSLAESYKSFDKMKTIDPEILCRGHYGAIVGKERVRENLRLARQSIESLKAFVLEKIRGGGSVDEMAMQITEAFSKGFLQFFPAEENYRLWRLLIRRTLEYLGIETEEKR
jgi:2-aminobenzoylacetyl-CoA thioesterase